MVHLILSAYRLLLRQAQYGGILRPLGNPETWFWTFGHFENQDFTFSNTFRKRWNTQEYPPHPPQGPRPGTGPGGRCPLPPPFKGISHFSRCVWNVKSRFPKYQNVRNPGVQNIKFGFLEMQKCQESGFHKTQNKTRFSKNMGFSKFRGFLRDAECHFSGKRNMEIGQLPGPKVAGPWASPQRVYGNRRIGWTRRSGQAPNLACAVTLQDTERLRLRGLRR